LAFAFEAPRASVPITTAASPANRRASHVGKRGGGSAQVAAELHVRQRGCLVHDRLGLVLEHRLLHRARVEQIDQHRLRAEHP
jgi:hypothetical protein